LLLETGGTVDGLVTPRLERHSGDAATLAANGLEHLTWCALVTATTVATVAVVPAAAPPPLVSSATLGTAPRLIGESLLGEELLRPCREQEGSAAVAAGEGLVGIAHETRLGAGRLRGIIVSEREHVHTARGAALRTVGREYSRSVERQPASCQNMKKGPIGPW